MFYKCLQFVYVCGIYFEYKINLVFSVWKEQAPKHKEEAMAHINIINLYWKEISWEIFLSSSIDPAKMHSKLYRQNKFENMVI